MKIISYIKSTLLALGLVLFAIVSNTYAALTPNMILGSAMAGTDAVQVTVYGADPSTSVQLFHSTASAYTSSNIGTTNSSGYLLATVNSASLGISPNSPVYVVVNGKQSQTQNWPNYTNNGSLPLSTNNVVVQAGQSTTVSASVSATLSVSNNSNSVVASVSINGNQILISGQNQGNSNITICGLGVGCGTIAVTVQPSNTSSPAAISFSQNVLTVASGQSQIVTLSGSGNYYVSSNSNPAVVSTTLSGSTININALSAGTAALSVCSSGNNSTSCGIINVTVTGQSNITTNTQNTDDNSVKFSPSSANLVIGQRQSVSILGTGNYFVSTNSNNAAVTANVNGSNVDLTGVTFGGSNIRICQLLGGCGNLYVYVSPSNTAPSPVSTNIGMPALSSISLSSNGSAGLFGVGQTLTITFSANQIINIPSVSVAGNKVAASGAGTGPYTATYTLTGKEGMPIPIEVTFTNTSGTGGKAYLTFGATAGSVGSVIGSGVAVSPKPITTSSQTFTQYLQLGSIGDEVRTLQQTLTKLGLYSGPITGRFGAQTEAAVKRYQAKHGLSQLGAVGPGTRSLLNQGI